VRSLVSITRLLRTRLREAAGFRVAGDVPPAVLAQLDSLCEQLRIRRDELDPRIESILAAEDERFGLQALGALLAKGTTSVMNPHSYVIKALTTNQANMRVIAALPKPVRIRRAGYPQCSLTTA
jgi:hypothetical protein